MCRVLAPLGYEQLAGTMDFDRIHLLIRDKVEHRIRRVAQKSNMLIECRRAAQAAWERGELPCPPAYDIRSDVDYWLRLREEKRRTEELKSRENRPSE